MITLQILLRYSKPVIRYVLYIEVNQFLKEKKKLSTSSFYNSLNNLERRGYVSFKQEGSSKRIMVEPTELGSSAIDLIFYYFIRNGLINESQFVMELSGIIQKKIGRTSSDSVLTILLDEFFNINNIELSVRFGKDVFILVKKERQDDFLKLGFDEIKFSEVRNGMIREPNDIFDLVAFSGYRKNPDLYELSRLDLLKEVVRVTKKGGIIILTTRSKLPETQNFFANELLKTYSGSVSERTFTEKELKEDFVNAGLTKYEIFNYKGMIAGIGWVT